MPEGGTIVAFDSVLFARSSGQIAIVGAARYEGLSGDAVYAMVDNSDNRWGTYGSATPHGPRQTTYSVGEPILNALVEHHGVPVTIAGAVTVTQSIGEINNCTFISDGPMNHTSDTRAEGLLPARETDATQGRDGTLIVGDLQDYPGL